MKNLHRKRIGLVLGSGAARGLAHIGVLEVLEEEKIPIDFIAGTSIGALIGGFYASGIGIEKLKEFAYQTNWKRMVTMFAPSPSKSGLVNGKRIEKLLRSFAGNRKIEELPIPFSCVATDINSGEEVIINKGDLVDGITASISMQGIFIPKVLGRRILADGGLVNPVPVSVALKMGANFVIASNVITIINQHSVEIDYSKNENKLKIPSIFSIILRASDIMYQKIIKDSLSMANLVINSEVSKIKMLEFYRAKEAVEIGKRTAKEVISEYKSRRRKW